MSWTQPRPRGFALCLLIVLAMGGAIGADGPSITVREYVARIDRLLAALDDDREGARQVDDDWSAPLRLAESGRVFEIPTAPIRRDVLDWRSRHDAVSRRRLTNELQLRRSEAERFEHPLANTSNERAVLLDVLAGREFQSLHGPTWRDRLQQRVLRWLVQLFGKVFNASTIPTIGRALVYGLLALAAAVLALVAYRGIRQTSDAGIAVLSRSTVFPKEWPRWLADAQAAAGRADWREAIHLTYWCAVAFLEAKGAWRPDRARTPREYVRLLAPSSANRDHFAALTREFERIWYGAAPADRDAFENSITRLRQLGCPLA